MFLSYKKELISLLFNEYSITKKKIPTNPSSKYIRQTI